MNSVKPSVFFWVSPCGVVRATTSAWSAPSASVMNVFWPLRAKRLPRFFAIVLVRMVLLPASGSVIAKQKRVLPLQASGR